jgi:hypothetical protein
MAGPIVVAPARLFIGPATSGNAMHVRLTKTTGSPLEVREVASTDPGFRASVSTVSEGREYDVLVTNVGAPGRGHVNARIMVRTNVPGQDTIVIPVVGQL